MNDEGKLYFISGAFKQTGQKIEWCKGAKWHVGTVGLSVAGECGAE